MRRILAALLCLMIPAQAFAAEKKTYTNKRYLYSVTYPADWHVKEVGGAAVFLSPLETPDDKFAENVEVNVEDLSEMGPVSLIDYHRSSVGNASKLLKDFKLLEEAKTEFAGHDAVAVLYTAVIKEKLFRFKKIVFLVGTDAYSLTYNAFNEDFEKYLPAAERVMNSVQASP